MDKLIDKIWDSTLLGKFALVITLPIWLLIYIIKNWGEFFNFSNYR